MREAIRHDEVRVGDWFVLLDDAAARDLVTMGLGVADRPFRVTHVDDQRLTLDFFFPDARRSEVVQMRSWLGVPKDIAGTYDWSWRMRRVSRAELALLGLEGRIGGQQS